MSLSHADKLFHDPRSNEAWLHLVAHRMNKGKHFRRVRYQWQWAARDNRATRSVFLRVELTDQELDELVTEIDTDKSGTIGLNELHAFLRCYDPSSKTALVVIDVQNDFISGSLAVETSDSIVTVINQIRDEFDHVYKGQKHNIDSYSAFFDNCKANDTGLTKQLEDAGVTDVYCCGLVFDICVKSSALHGAEMGFRVSVIEDACKPLNEKDVEPTKSVLHEVMLQGIGLHQSVNLTVPIHDALDALRSCRLRLSLTGSAGVFVCLLRGA
ncbi:Nicotinamidase (Nicotinamide deamidase) (NAMase) (Pyrazinamidase) (PZAase) [Durusdinium trenchii]|uniref:nicotinamidase n=1 Tax=Durusdinium trenchii TaxID=1381693 RepID=A0ABP0J3X6_9DINO